MHKAFCIFLIVATSPTVWTETKWSKEIPSPDSPLTRERRQFSAGDWIPLTQPCLTCRPLTDPADAGKRHEEIGLTPPRPPTVTRQIHKNNFFPQDESSILSVPPPPVFSRNQISNTNTRFPNFIQQFGSPNSLQFETQPVFPQSQFLSQPFLGSTSLLGSDYPQVLPLLNNPSALLVQGNLSPTQEIKTQKINAESKIPNVQENVIIEQNRQQPQHQVNNQQVVSQVPSLQVSFNNAPVNFHTNRQQQNIIEGNILTPPPLPNNTFPDIIIPGLDKEEIQLLYVPLETLKQRANQQQQQQPQRQQISSLQVQSQQHHQIPPQHVQVKQHLQVQQQQHQIAPQQVQVQQHHQIPPQQVQVQHHQQQHHQTSHQQGQVQQHQQIQQHHQILPQQVQAQHHQQIEQQVLSQPQQNGKQQPIQKVTPTPPSIKFTQQPGIRSSELPSTSQPAGHFITHSATPTSSHDISSTFQQVPVTPSTLFFQHVPFQSSPGVSSTPETPTLQTLLTPSTLNQNFSPFPSVTPSENLITLPEKHSFAQEFLTTPNTLVDQLPVKDAFGKEIVFDDVQKVNKFKSASIQQQEEQQRQLLLQEQEKRRLHEQKLIADKQERERLQQEKQFREQKEREKQQELLREKQENERKQKLIKEQQEREHQEKLLLEQQERERQQKILREQQERERKHKLLREQQERERQESILRAQEERERQHKILLEQQERERQEAIYREQQQKALQEKQERERQLKLQLEQQERERKHKLLREQQERERQESILRAQEERERQQKILLEQQERERQEAIYREQQQKALRERQERERQRKLQLEQQEREREHKILLEQQEREKKQKLLLEQQERENEQLERERQEKILLEEKRQQFLLQQQQEREQQLLLQEQQDRERQLLQQQYLLQLQQEQDIPVPTQFDLQQPSLKPQIEAQTEIPDESLVPHQPPLSVFYGGSKGQPRITEVLKELRGAKTIAVLDQYLENIPRVFVGPANMTPPKGYGKFELPYLSNIDLNRVERKVERLPFFVAPLNFVPPSGYSKIPFPSPHVGSVVVSSDATLQKSEKGSTVTPYLSTLLPRLRTTTQAPLTTHIQQIQPKQVKIKDTRLPAEHLPNPELINELKTEALITTTIAPETTTQTRGRRPYYRTKARRPTSAPLPQVSRRPESSENTPYQKPETVERKPSVKFPKQRRQRVKTTTEEYDSVNSANRQFLVETSPTPAAQEHFEKEEFGGQFYHLGSPRTEVQGLFEVNTQQPNTETPVNTLPTASPLSTAGLAYNGDFGVTTEEPFSSTAGTTISTPKPSSTVDYDRFGHTDYFASTQRIQPAVEVENSGFTGFYEQTPRIPVGIENNGDSGFFSQTSFSSSGVDNTFPTNQNVEKTGVSDFNNFHSIYFQEGAKVQSGSLDGATYFEQKPFQKEVSHVAHKVEETVGTTPKSVSYETIYSISEQTTEVLKATTIPPTKNTDKNAEEEVNIQYVELAKENEEVPEIITTTQPPIRSKTRFRTKSRGQVNYASSQTSTHSPYVRKRVVYKKRTEEPEGSVTEDVRQTPKYRGLRKGYQTSTETTVEYEPTKGSYTVKPHRRVSAPSVLRRRKPTTAATTTTTERPNYPPNFDFNDYSPSGVSNDVFDDQIRESSLSRGQYAENAVVYTATTTTSTTPTPEELFTRRKDEDMKTEEIPTENYPISQLSEVYVSDITKVTPATRPTSAFNWESTGEAEEVKKFQDSKKAYDPSLEKKNARRRIRVRVHKRPHEQIETAESQNLGTVANALIPPTPAKPSVEPDLYRFSKTGFNFDQSEKFAGTKNQAYVRNITSDILENTAAFSAPGIESQSDLKKVTIVGEDNAAATTTEFVPETTEKLELEESKDQTGEMKMKMIAETTTENLPAEITTYITTMENTESDTEEPATTTPTTTTTTSTTTTTAKPTTEEDVSQEIQMSTATEISHETEICFRGKCIKTNSATADDDLRKLVQSADKVLIT